jgi:hypothetical protein
VARRNHRQKVLVAWGDIGYGKVWRYDYDNEEVLKKAKARGEAFKKEDLEYGRRVLQNYDRLPQEVKDKIEALKEIAPEYTVDLEKMLIKVLGAKPVQDADPSFWAVDKFEDGSLLLNRTDGTHWKATKL